MNSRLLNTLVVRQLHHDTYTRFFLRRNIRDYEFKTIKHPSSSSASSWYIYQVFLRRNIRDYEFKTVNKHFGSLSASSWYIPGFLFDVPDLLELPKPYKEKIHCFIIFQQSRVKSTQAIRD